jgi:antitoxin component of MazEF toxin-antitoxin module
MDTEVTLRRQGNSVGINIPPALLRHMGLSVGQTVSLHATAEGLLIKAKPTRRYTAAELNALCDPDAPMPADLQDWDNMPATGSER